MKLDVTNIEAMPPLRWEDIATKVAGLRAELKADIGALHSDVTACKRV